MSITDELRHNIKGAEQLYGRDLSILTAIADRIDAEHEAMLADVRKTVYQGLIELPKDADGEYTNVGDEMCGYGWPNGGVYCRAIVNEVTILVGPQDGAYRGWLMWATNECRHYHAPTVEDVLEELLREYDRDDSELTDGEIVEMFAKRLQLREDA